MIAARRLVDAQRAGARLSWLSPAFLVGTVYLAAPSAAGGAAQGWAWVMQPGVQAGAWPVAVAAFVMGTSGYARRGARHMAGES